MILFVALILKLRADHNHLNKFKIMNRYSIKKLLLPLLLVAFIVTPMITFAQVVDKGTCDNLKDSITLAAGGNDSLTSAVLGIFPQYCSATDLIQLILNILFTLSGTIAVLFIILGGYQYMTGAAAGGSEAVGKGKETLLNAIIGLIIIVLSAAIVNIIIGAVTGGRLQ